MSAAAVIKQEPVNDVRLLSVTAANLEVEIKTEPSDDEVEPCDHGTFLKCCKQEPVDSVVDNVDEMELDDVEMVWFVLPRC